jgi:hypothetical protein
MKFYHKNFFGDNFIKIKQLILTINTRIVTFKKY